jgi:hypothetical protein
MGILGSYEKCFPSAEMEFMRQTDRILQVRRTAQIRKNSEEKGTYLLS